MRQGLLVKHLRTFLTRSRKMDRPAVTSVPVSVRVTEEPPGPGAPDLTVEDISLQQESSPLVISANSSDTEAISSTLVKKYEIGSGANKVNVRIYKEPPIKPIVAEPPGNAESKQVDGDTLMLRWKKDGTETSLEPSNLKM